MMKSAIFVLFSFGCSGAESENIQEHEHDNSAELSDLVEQIADLKAQLDEADARLTQLSEALDSHQDGHDEDQPSSEYTDADALAAIQNSDPWNYPNQANIQNLWSSTDYGRQWLENSRWTMDNRSNPAGESPRHELIQFFHETKECGPNSTFADCNSTGAIKFYVNGPRITDNDWSPQGFRNAALRTYNTHASGLYMASFGQKSYVTDYGGLIPPSGIHLEPHGAHQALRIDGTGNSGENIRIDTTQGSTGIAIYASPAEGLYCGDLGLDCSLNYPLYLRGGTLHFEDLKVERSATDARNGGAAWLHDTSHGIEHFYNWHVDPDTSLPVHCTWNTLVSDDSIVKLTPYSTSPDLLEAHSYVIVDVWGPGNAPANCTGGQMVKTDASGVYGYNFASNFITQGGFSVAILGPDSTPLYPGDWGEADRPSFLYEVFDKL